jgi:hypothetical protein
MTPTYTLTMTQKEQMELMGHLFTGDGKESAAIGLCALSASANPIRILVKEIVPVPLEVCTLRTPVTVQWPFEWLDPQMKVCPSSNFTATPAIKWDFPKSTTKETTLFSKVFMAISITRCPMLA